MDRREIYVPFVHGWDMFESLSINLLKEVWMTSLFVCVPFCWDVCPYPSGKSEFIVRALELQNGRLRRWKPGDAHIVYSIGLIPAWYGKWCCWRHAMSGESPVNLMISFAAAFIGLCVCGGTSLFTTVLQKFKDFPGRSKTHRTPYFHCPCKL